MQKDKVRIFALARELDMESKDLIALCRQAGLDVKNQLSTLEPDQRDRIVESIQKGVPASVAAPAARPAVPPTPAIPTPVGKMRVLDRRPARRDSDVPETPIEPAVPALTQPLESAIIPAGLSAESRPPSAPLAPVAAEAPRPAPLNVTAPATAARIAPAAPTASAAQDVPPSRPTAPAPPRPAPTSSGTNGGLPPARPAATPARPVGTAPSNLNTTPSTPRATLPPAAEPQKPGPVEKPAVTAATPAPTGERPPESAPPAVRTRETPRPAAGTEGTPPARTAEQPGRRPGESPAPRPGVAPAMPGQRPAGTPQTGRPAARAPEHGAGGSGISGQEPRPQQSPPNLGGAGHRPMRVLGSQPRPGSGGGGGSVSGGPVGGERRGLPPGPRVGTRTGAPPPRIGTPLPSRPVGKAPEEAKRVGPAPSTAKKLAEIPSELRGGGSSGPITVKDIEKKIEEKQRLAQAPPLARGPVVPVPPVVVDDGEGEEEGDAKGKGKGKRPVAGGVPGRADRHKDRAERQKRMVGNVGRGGKPNLLDDDSPRHRKDRNKVKVKRQGTEKRIGKVPISLPITVRSLCAAIGAKQGDVIFKLMALSTEPVTINSNLDPDMAESLALDFGVELNIKRGTDAEGDVIRKGKVVDNPEDLRPRAPVVTIMGHVDHGKTSLLDKIRRSNVAATEAGGITQVIRAWRVEHDGKPITFLDTPGHEAFTKMRARGAQVTDIAVIVVAADDGVMPQTEEAVAHAKAAGVSIVVAINKVDMPQANIARTERQLYGLELLPDNMGGDVPFVQTSAATGKGIDDLLENILVVAELKELKANPNKPATGTCLEAHMSEREGVKATLIVQDGTLREGDVILCGATFGTVRKMYNDLRVSIDEAGPSMPVIVTGLDEVPNADDPFHVVEDSATARDIATKRKDRFQAASLTGRKPLTIESLKEAKITELKVILKAEAKGSIEAIRNELEKLKHDEVRVRILHVGIGAINNSDVQLALTSPEDTLILGFNVVADNAAQALAEERGIKIREYNIIYDLANDIKSALEGKLKPREEVIHLGRAMVRETFKISRVGTIAGCYVTQGTIERSAKVRIIRGGVVVFPPPERTVGLESLKRFKEDAREVREGFECGLKIAGFDDIKVDDVIEAYRIDQVVRTL